MSDLTLRTQAIHAGDEAGAAVPGVAPPLHMANSYAVEAGLSFSAEGLAEDAPFIYSRWSNPTVHRLERRLAALEEAERAVCFSSGMAAISGLFTQVLTAGSHLVMTNVGYAGAVEYARQLLPQMGVQVTFVDTSDVDAVRNAIRPDTRLVHIETPCNPILRLADIRALATVAHEADALLSVDSTFASPEVTQPLRLGADIVMHSLTKYIGGHGDGLGGVLAGAEHLIEPIRASVGVHAGGVLSPFNAWLFLRGVATLPLRMRAHSESAAQIAEFLSGHASVTQVVFPGMDTHPQHELVRAQMHQSSGMVTFQIADGPRMALQLQRRLKLIAYAVSLGDVRSLLYYIDTAAIMESSFRLTGRDLEAYRQYAGDGVFRLSVGLEDPGDLCRDLAQALA